MRIKNTRQSLALSDVVQERDDLQGMDVSTHGAKDDVVGEGEKPEAEETEDEDRDPTEKLIESVLEDVYAVEAMAILLDLSAQQKEVADKGQKQ